MLLLPADKSALQKSGTDHTVPKSSASSISVVIWLRKQYAAGMFPV